MKISEELISVSIHKIEPLLQSISTNCQKSGLTIGVAESVTSGLIQFLLSNAAGAQLFFQGGITAYNTGQKTKHLGIEPIKASSNNAVSSDVATFRETPLGTAQLLSIPLSSKRKS